MARYYYAIFGKNQTYTGSYAQNVKWLNWLKANNYANGGLIGKAIKNTEGVNGGFVLAHSGEYILNEHQLRIADHMVSNLVNFAKLNGAVNKNNVTSSAKIDTVEMNINLPNVNNYEDFKNALVRDRHIQNIIQDITIGNALGKNSLNKYRHK